ncbi:MAG TPA: response regulator [Xanthobacteraceae bacterium]|nr:response regulator [Xanthobacteraceae bacterium]
MTDQLHVAIIDSDQAVLDSLRLYFSDHQFVVTSYSDAKEFLAALNRIEQLDCVICDIRIPVMSGIDLLDKLKQLGYDWPIILMSANANVPMAVAAIKKGAFDFIDEPLDASHLLESVRAAVSARKQSATLLSELEQLRSRFAALSSRQREVMELVVAGLSNKEIALRLKISPKTVDHHRAWVMERMGAHNLPELVRQAMRLHGHLT